MLVGYLAVIALPLNPFAFASPLAAIYFDGYVTVDTTQNHIDGALMERVLGIVETCQTVNYYTGNQGGSGIGMLDLGSVS
jgi:hypothetical protein